MMHDTHAVETPQKEIRVGIEAALLGKIFPITQLTVSL